MIVNSLLFEKKYFVKTVFLDIIVNLLSFNHDFISFNKIKEKK